MKYVIIEQAENNEAYITHLSKKDIENYQSVGTGDYIILSESAYNNMCMSCMGC